MSADSETPRNRAIFRELALSNSFVVEALVELLVEKGFVKREEITELVTQLERKATVDVGRYENHR